jgi:hypothetical protein
MLPRATNSIRQALASRRFGVGGAGMRLRGGTAARRFGARSPDSLGARQVPAPSNAPPPASAAPLPSWPLHEGPRCHGFFRATSDATASSLAVGSQRVRVVALCIWEALDTGTQQQKRAPCIAQAWGTGTAPMRRSAPLGLAVLCALLPYPVSPPYPFFPLSPLLYSPPRFTAGTQPRSSRQTCQP